jgi:hypothetical protein
MKTKIISTLVAFGLCINAALAGNSARIGYASDYFYRGAQKAQESIQASLGLSQELGVVNGSLHICSNQAVDSGNDSYHMGAGVGTSFLDDLLSVYAGINHFEDVPGGALSEAQLKLGLGVALSPSVSVYRDLDESLYTFELGVSQGFETEIVDLSVSASVGNTETSSTTDTDYYNIGIDATKDVSDNTTVGLSVDYIDADNISREFVFGAGLTFNF